MSLTAPQLDGSYQGNWQLRDAQGVAISAGGGGTVWVNIKVQSANPGTVIGPGGSPSGHITLFDVSPPSPSPTTRVHLVGRIRYFPEYRSMRFFAGNQAFGEQANLRPIGDQLEISADWDTSSLPRGTNAVAFEVATKSDPNWASAERQVIIYTLTGTPTPAGHPPDRPALKSPYNWFLRDAAGSSASVEMCVFPSSDPDGDTVQYYFEILDGANNPVNNSGWSGSTCWQPTVSPGTWGWRAKTGDGSHQSEWSQDTWHFSVASGDVSVGDPTIYLPNDPDNTHMCVLVTYGGILAPEVQAWINQAADGSESGEWRLLDHYGPNTTPDCTQSNVHGFWIRSANYLTGQHRIRIAAHKADSGASAQRSITHTIPFMRPPGPQLVAPSTRDNNGTWWNTTSIRFEWQASLRTDSYQLRASTNANPWADGSPVLDVTLGSNTTSYTYDFGRDYNKLYWSVRASNNAGSVDTGGDVWIGIDRVAPACSVQAPPSTVTETVFQVNWSATDASSGPRTVDVEYRDSSRTDWATWLSNAPVSRPFDLFTATAGHSYSFRCRTTDVAGNTGTFSANGTSETKVDLTARPPTPWWDTAYSSKRNITALNNMPSTAMPAGYPVRLHFDGSTTPTASEIYGASQAAQKCNDLRVVYNDATELDRLVTSCSSSAIDLIFASKISLAGATSNGTSHQLYYGNASAGSPPADPLKVWPPLSDGNTVGLWFLSEGSGSSSTDLSGRGNNITSIGTLSWTDGKFGKALSNSSLDSGPPGAFVPGNASLSSASLTFEAFVKRGTTPYGHLAGQGESNSQRERWLLKLEGSHLSFYVWPFPGAGAASVSSDDSILPDTEWHHIAVSFDGAQTVKFYRDGTLTRTATLSQSGANSTNFDFFIGSGFQSSAERFNGLIDQVRLSNIVRTSFPYATFAAITSEPSLAAGAVIARPVPVTGAPDLAVLAVNIYPNPSGGRLAEIVVQNQGAQPTQNGFYTDLYINHQPTGAGDYTGSVTTWIASSIDPGQVITLTAALPDVVQSSALALAAAATDPVETSFTVYAQTDSTGALGAASQTAKTISPPTTVCSASPDSFEGDDSRASAKPFSVNGATQRHNFHSAGDQDWVSFTANTGVSYTISTANLAAAADTVLVLYGTDGTTALATNDDDGSNLSSRIVWQAPADGTYFIKVTGWSPNAGGCSTAYDLNISSQAPLTLSVVKAGSGSGTVTSGDSKINCGSTCSTTYATTTSVPLSASPATGSTFVGWGGACVGIGLCTVSVDGPKTVTATFRPAVSDPTIPGDINRDGIVDVFDQAILQQNFGQTNCGNPADLNGDCKVDIFDLNILLTNFGRSVITLSVTKTGSGAGTVRSSDNRISCSSTCSANYTSGDPPVTLTATAALGSSFLGWGGACSGTGTCQVVVDGPKSVTANFQQINVGVVVSRPPVQPPSGGPALTASLTARAGCGTIDHVQFGNVGVPFANAVVSVVSPAGGPSNQKAGFDYRPPANTPSVTILIQRVVQSGGATVNPVYFYDGCGQWRTFVGGGPGAFQ